MSSPPPSRLFFFFKVSCIPSVGLELTTLSSSACSAHSQPGAPAQVFLNVATKLNRACIPEFWILVFILILLTYCPLIYLLVWNKGGGVCLIPMWFELERGRYCIPQVASPPRASEHWGRRGAQSGRECGKAAGTRLSGMEGTCEEGDRIVTGVEVIEKPALN